MKFNKSTKISTIALAVIFNTIPAYATDVVTATNVNSINQSDISVISSKNGEVISKMDSLNSVFKISFTDNNYVKTIFAKVVNDKDNSGYVSVYSEATTDSKVIGSMSIGSMVVVGAKENDFVQIFFNEDIGYIKEEYLIPSKPKEENPIEEESTGKYVKITADTGVNFRQEPSTSSKILEVIQGDLYIDFIKDEGSWLKVRHNGKTGYISADFGIITDKKEEKPIANAKAEDIINFAKLYIGKPYIYGSTNLNVGTDCSGFTYAVFKHFGINLNRVSRDQYLNGIAVEKSNLMPGDLVFFAQDTKNISHVGIYLGNNEYIHSTDSKNRGVMISSLNTDYAKKTYYGARRVIPN